MHKFSCPAKFRILLYHFFEAIAEVFDLVRACYVASPVHSCTAMYKYNSIPAFFMDSGVKLCDEVIDIVDIQDIADHCQEFGDGFSVLEGIQERPEYKFLLILSFCGILIEIFLLDVSILGLFGCEEVEKADDDQLIPIKACKVSEMSFQLTHLELIILTHGQIASNQVVIESLVVVDDAEPFWKENGKGKRGEEEEKEKIMHWRLKINNINSVEAFVYMRKLGQKQAKM